ncbi:MAG: type II secretion system F family protein [bacterium]|nr:type II secretion system F family protein [bacterium]
MQIGGAKERAYVVENLAVLLGAGMDVLSAVSAIETQVRSVVMKKTLATIREELSNGAAIWRTLDAAKILPKRATYLVRLGEDSGRLAENLTLIAKQQEKDRVLTSKVRSAMVYPAFVLGLTLVVGLGVAWFILPRLSTVFSSLNVHLPAITIFLINFGIFLQHWGAIAVPAAIIIIGGAVVVAFRRPGSRAALQGFALKIPAIRNVVLEVELTRFGFVLGTLLQAGLPVIEAVESLEQSSAITQYKKLYAKLRRDIEDGDSFHASLRAYPKSNRLIPIPIQELVATGEQSGNLAEMLLRISAIYEQKTDQSTKNLASILEPILLVIVWLGVLAVAVAIILPIYSLVGQFNP